MVRGRIQLGVDHVAGDVQRRALALRGCGRCCHSCPGCRKHDEGAAACKPPAMKLESPSTYLLNIAMLIFLPPFICQLPVLGEIAYCVQGCAAS